MSLSDALQYERIARQQKGPRCTMCLLLESLPDADRDALQVALDDESFTHAGIARALRSEGHVFLAITVSRHRRQECQQP